MSIDPRYIPAYSIETVLLDKDTGEPMAGGQVFFYEDSQRTILKPVYQITGTSPNYTFMQLPNPMILSAIGTFQDSLDNPVVPYFLPYDGEGNVDLYYVRVLNSDDVFQFDREAVPYVVIESDLEILSVISNELSNPQFAEVNFDTLVTSSVTYSFMTVTNQVIPIAPDWDIIVTCPTSGSLTVTQLTPQGSVNIPTNAGTLLQISSAGLTSLVLRQRLFGSPNLWGSGYLSASFVAKTYSGASALITMYYSQSNGTGSPVPIVAANLPGSDQYATYPGAAFIPASTNPDTFPGAYVDIYFNLPLSIMIDITSVMVAFTGQVGIDNIEYEQDTFARQVDHLFHYYQPEINFKPISSYLTGWDFPLNPAQFTGSGNRSVASQSTGDNKCFYTWDQTILFQSVDNSVSVSNNSTFTVTATKDTQFSIVQYLAGAEAVDILLQLLVGELSSNLRLSPSVLQTLNISLWWTANSSLPSVNNCFITSLDANGHPATVVSGWNEIKRINTQNATFPTVSTGTVDYGFSGWTDGAAYMTGKFFAIAIGTNTVVSGNNIDFKSISLVPGSIPTIPAPQTFDEVLRECQHYYEKSYAIADQPGKNTNVNQKLLSQNSANYAGIGANNVEAFPTGFELDYSAKRTVPTLIIYTPSGTSGSVLATLYYALTMTEAFTQLSNPQAVGTFWNSVIGSNKASYTPKTVDGLVGADNASEDNPFNSANIAFQFTADARLGLV